MVLAIIAIVVLAATWGAALLLPLPLWLPIAVTAMALVAGAGLWAWRRRKARLAAGEIESTLKSQADAHAAAVRPDEQVEIDAMLAEFQKAVGALKSSKLARGGRDALAILPWYLIIGPPGAGKSTALRNSGLQFPYLSARGGGVRGVGGTRNCEWWLTNEAVVLDTAGRYTTEDEDHEEWTSFLDTLARTRPRKPINGLIVAVSVGDLGGESESGVIDLAKRIRERMDEVMARLQMVLPAYLFFTKCDLLPGFVETFGDLRKNERGQIWGFTLPLVGLAEGPGDAFRARFDELLAVVAERAVTRIGEERQLGVRERIWQFPQQLEAIRSNLATFVENLFAENVFQDTPRMRGVYLTSGTQEGRTIDRVLGAMAQAFGIRPQLGEEPPVVEAKSYFLRDVFRKVIFPDQELAVRSSSAVRRDHVQRYALAAGALLAALALFAFPLRSFLLNRSLVRSTDELVTGVNAMLSETKGTPRLAALDPLRERLELLMRFQEHGPAFSMGFGMYQGDALAPHVRRLYAAAVRRVVIEPVYALELSELDAFCKLYEGSAGMPAKGEYAAHYDRLKLHLLLSGPRATGEPRISEENRAFVAARVLERWIGGSTARDPGAGRRVEANAALFARLLSEEPALALTRYDDLVRRTRGVLSRVPYVTLALERLVKEAEPRGLERTLPSLLGEPIPVLRNDARVRGAFTLEGYQQVIKARLEDPATVLEPWVLARDARDEEDRLAVAARALRSRYFAEYIDEWRQFLEATRVDTNAGALTLMQELTRGEPPPLVRLFRDVANQTRLGGTAGAALQGAGEGLMERVRRLGGASQTAAAAAVAAAGDGELGPVDVERAFVGFTAFGVPPSGAAAAAKQAAGGAPPPAGPRSVPLDLYQEQLAFVRDALRVTADGGEPGPLLERVQAARTKVRALIDGAEVGWRPRLESLLWPALDAASGDSVKHAASGAATEWCATVAKPFRRSLDGRYPFSRDGDDAAIADVAEFFRKGGVIWGFYDQSLKSEIQRVGDGFQFARQLGGVSGFRPELLTFLRRAQEVTQVLFPSGAASPMVEFSVRVRPTPGVAIVFFEVDGQKVDYRNGPEEWHRLTWPVAGKSLGASLRVRAVSGREEVVQQDGEWGLFRLLEAGRMKEPPVSRDFTMVWALPSLGTSVTLDFRPSRSDSPFLGVRRGAEGGKLLAPFRAGVAPPANIGKAGPGCG